MSIIGNLESIYTDWNEEQWYNEEVQDKLQEVSDLLMKRGLPYVFYVQTSHTDKDDR